MKTKEKWYWGVLLTFIGGILVAEWIENPSNSLIGRVFSGSESKSDFLLSLCRQEQKSAYIELVDGARKNPSIWMSEGASSAEQWALNASEDFFRICMSQ